MLYRLGVKILALLSARYKQSNLKAAKDKIRIVRFPAAEHAAAMMLVLHRNLHPIHRPTNVPQPGIAGLIGFDMHKKTAGIIGVGKTGLAVIQILQNLGMDVLAYDRDRKQVERAGCQFADLDTIYKRSDVISLHCPLNAETEQMINANALSKMKENVILINVEREGLIDASALIDSLKAGKIGAVGLAICEEESQLFNGFPNVLISSRTQ